MKNNQIVDLIGLQIYYLNAYTNPDTLLFDADVMRRGNNQEYRKLSIEELQKKELENTINRVLQ